MNFIRRNLSSLACFVMGHLFVVPQSVPTYLSCFFEKGTEYVCIRCMKQYSPAKEVADLFFTESPFQRRITDALSRDEKRTCRDLSDQLTAFLRSVGGTAARGECEEALGYPKGVNWTRVREKAKVETAPNRGGKGYGGSQALWSLAKADSTPATPKPSTTVSGESEKVQP